MPIRSIERKDAKQIATKRGRPAMAHLAVHCRGNESWKQKKGRDTVSSQVGACSMLAGAQG